MRGRAWTMTAVIMLAVVAFSLLSVCDAFFSCGCRPWWWTSAEHCNIHRAGPHCPWCTGTPLRQAWVGAIMLATTGLSMWTGAKLAPRRPMRAAITLGIAGYLLGATIAGLLSAWITDYPTWLGFSL